MSNSDSQVSGIAAAARPIASVSPNAIAAPIHVVRNARSRLAGADIGADHRHQRPPETENQRYKQVFEPAADAVAGNCSRPETADQRGDDGDGQIGQYRGYRGDRPDPQDIGKQAPLEPDAGNADRTMPRLLARYQANAAVPAA